MRYPTSRMTLGMASRKNMWTVDVLASSCFFIREVSQSCVGYGGTFEAEAHHKSCRLAANGRLFFCSNQKAVIFVV